MSDLREPFVCVACGSKGVGKTHTSKKILDAYSKGNPAKGIRPKKVLIFDINQEFTEIMTLPLSHVKAFSYHPHIQMRRILPIRPSGEKMGLDDMAIALGHIAENFSNGLLLIEDIKKYISDNFRKDIVGHLVTNRHKNLDLLTHVQYKSGAATPKLIANTNVLRIHHTSDTFERNKNRFEGHLEVLKISEELVEYKNSFMPKDAKRFYCYTNLDFHEVYGDFSKEDFIEAISNYIDNNYQEVLNPLLKRRDRSGKQMFTYESAYKFLANDLFTKYYGNPDK